MAFNTPRDRQTIWARNVDGSGKEEALEPGGLPDIPSHWAPDGKSLALTRNFPATDIWVLPTEGKGKAEARLFQTEGYGPVFSPDGLWIVYSSAAVAGSNDQVVAKSVTGSGRLQLTSEGGAYPVWVGREIFFIRKSRLYVMGVETRPALRTSAAQPLFDAPFDLSTGPLRNYDVSPDGQTFVFVSGASEAPWKQFDVALHWTPAPALEGK